MRFRNLRIAWSLACAVTCMLLFSLWVQSYWQCNYFVHTKSGSRITVVGSNQGAIYLIRTPPAQFQPPLAAGWEHRVERAVPLQEFSHQVPANSDVTIVPIWSLIAVLAAFAAVPSMRLSHRTFLIGIALVAFGPGLAVYSCR